MNWTSLVLAILSFSLMLLTLIPNPSAYTQVDNTAPKITSNITANVGVQHNGTGIMQNTSGILDDAIYALKESIRSLFGK